jgi:adenylosuccinate lyase
MPAWRGEGDFLDLLKKDKGVAEHLDMTSLTALFDDAHHTKHVETIFRRVFGTT